MFLLWSQFPRHEKVSFQENWRCIEAEGGSIYFKEAIRSVHYLSFPFIVIFFTWVLARDLFCRAKEEPLESFLEVLIEGDVDDGVDHGMWVGEHVDPEGVPGELMV